MARGTPPPGTAPPIFPEDMLTEDEESYKIWLDEAGYAIRDLVRVQFKNVEMKEVDRIVYGAWRLQGVNAVKLDDQQEIWWRVGTGNTALIFPIANITTEALSCPQEGCTS